MARAHSIRFVSPRPRMTTKRLLARLAFASALALAADAPRADDAPSAAVPATLETAPQAAAPRPELGEARFDAVLGRYVAPLGDRRAVLTLDPRLQGRLEKT